MYVNATGDLACFDFEAELFGAPATAGAARDADDGGSMMGTTAWNYQACTELPLEPITSDGYGFFPPADGAQTRDVIANCAQRFGVATRAEWLRLAFGDGADLARSLSNVYFGENDKDPWHIGTESIAAALNHTRGGRGVFRRLAVGGAHHQELRFSSPHDAPDVAAMRADELRVVRAWLGER